MADSLLFENKPEATEMPAVLVEGSHTPDALAGASGVYRRVRLRHAAKRLPIPADVR